MFQVTVVRAPGEPLSLAVGALLAPEFVQGERIADDDLPRFEPWFLDPGLAYGPGGGSQERPPFRPVAEIVIGPVGR